MFCEENGEAEGEGAVTGDGTGLLGGGEGADCGDALGRAGGVCPRVPNPTARTTNDPNEAFNKPLSNWRKPTRVKQLKRSITSFAVSRSE